MVFVAGAADGLGDISRKSLVFLVLSGMATGASWLCYFKALSCGDINKVVPVDKLSTVLTVLLAMLFFGETHNLPIRLVSIALIGVGIFLMTEIKKQADTPQGSKWAIYAAASAIFASLTAILAKIGVSGVESNLATAIRTIVVLLMSLAVLRVKGKHKRVRAADNRELAFICVSGVATGASWLCYYYAIQNGDVSVVVPIDKLSIIVTVIFSRVVFKETLSRRAAAGLALMVAGTLAMTVFS